MEEIKIGSLSKIVGKICTNPSCNKFFYDATINICSKCGYQTQDASEPHDLYNKRVGNTFIK